MGVAKAENSWHETEDCSLSLYDRDCQNETTYAVKSKKKTKIDFWAGGPFSESFRKTGQFSRFFFRKDSENL